MKISIVISMLAMAWILQSTGTPDGSEVMDDLKAIVDGLGNRAEKCFLSGDVDAMLQYYCDDVVSMPNFHPMVRGKSDLGRMTRAIFASGMKFKSLQSTTIEVKNCGGFVYEIGTFTQEIIMPGAKEPVKQFGKYVTIWKRQPDGGLKIAVEIYNSDEFPRPQSG